MFDTDSSRIARPGACIRLCSQQRTVSYRRTTVTVATAERYSLWGDSRKSLCRRKFYPRVYVRLSRSIVFGPAVLVALIAGGGLVLTRFPILSVGSVTIQTSMVVGLIAGILLVPSIVSQYRSRERRESIQWALFAVGIPLSLSQRSPFDWVGVLAVCLSIAVAWAVDRRLLRLTFRHAE